MKMLLFSFYYGKLQLGVLLGVYQTANPLDLKWRWNYWQDTYHRRRVRML